MLQAHGSKRYMICILPGVRKCGHPPESEAPRCISETNKGRRTSCAVLACRLFWCGSSAAAPPWQGVKFQSTVPLNHFDEEVCVTVLKQPTAQRSFQLALGCLVATQPRYKIHSADVLVKEEGLSVVIQTRMLAHSQDITVDDFIDVIDGNRKYCKCSLSKSLLGISRPPPQQLSYSHSHTNDIEPMQLSHPGIYVYNKTLGPAV